MNKALATRLAKDIREYLERERGLLVLNFDRLVCQLIESTLDAEQIAKKIVKVGRRESDCGTKHFSPLNNEMPFCEIEELVSKYARAY